MSEKYIVVKLSEAKKLADIIREEVTDNDGSHSYVFGDMRFRLRELAPLLRRIEREEGADMQDIADRLKRMDYCLACEVEGQKHTCESIHARKLGRRLKRLIDRAENNQPSDEAHQEKGHAE